MKFLFAILFSLAAFAADVVPDARKIDWTFAGIPGGIPNRTTIFTTYTASATSAQIQGGIDNCPSNQVVKLSAGTYTLLTALTIDRDGVTLRGATNAQGAPTVILNFDANSGGWGLIDFAKALYPDGNWGTLVSSVNISSGYTKGSTQIVLASTLTGLTVGEMLNLDQLSDDSLVYDNGTQGSANWRPGSSPKRTYKQHVIVTGISGTTIDFTPPLSGHYWASGQDPEAYRFVDGQDDVVFMSGVEDVVVNRVDGGDGSHNVSFGPAARCWAKNVKARQAATGLISFAYTTQCEARDCDLGTHDSVASATYSFWCYDSSFLRLENNIFTNTPCAIGGLGIDSSFIGYNVGTNFPYVTEGWLPECVMIGHDGHTYANLFEGNFFPSLWGDWIHGNGSHNVYVRNRLTGWEATKTASTRPVNFEENQDTNTVAGNILGTDSYHTGYTGNPLGIYNIDADSDEPSLIRLANYNTVDDGIHTASPDERIGSDTLEDSYYYDGSDRPEHWGDRPWPPFDYESPNTSLTAVGYTNNAAGYRLFFGEWPGAAEGGTGGTITLGAGTINLGGGTIRL